MAFPSAAPMLSQKAFAHKIHTGGFIQKPFRLKDLVDKIRELLPGVYHL